MLRRGAFSVTGVSRFVLGLQREFQAPLVANDGPVQSFNDAHGKPAVSKEMINKYGPMAKYSNPNLAKVDTSAEVVLNTYPEGDHIGRIEAREKADSSWEAGCYDEVFFRKNILKPKVALKHEDRDIVLDYVLTTALMSFAFMLVRYLVMPVWWLGQMQMTMVYSSNIEVDVPAMSDKECITVIWRGKPVFIYKRSEIQMKQLAETPMSALKDPQTDEQRFPERREFAVCIAICTHLGCIPVANEGAFGGFFCPCHGSHYDASARIRQGPAPLNLEVPPYKWISDNLLYLGS